MWTGLQGADDVSEAIAASDANMVDLDRRKFRDRAYFHVGAGGSEGPSWAPHHIEGDGDVLIPATPYPGDPVPPDQVPGGPCLHHV